MLKSLTVPLLFFVLLSTACTTSTLQIDQAATYIPTASSQAAEQADHFWWQFRFKLQWPDGEPPAFSNHLLIADQIIAPTLVEYGDNVGLWRLHRRAGRDQTGHQLSLIFYANEATANAVAASMDAKPLTQWLRNQDMIEATRFSRRTGEELARMEDTSDGEWPMEIQRSWPYFIMGVSQTWLAMVQELSGNDPLSGEVDYNAFVAHYQTVDNKLTTQWRDFGQHAYLHHLSAVFGYQPLKLRNTELRSF
ncbi:MAG: hypothetical protein V7720_14505 [Halioglobus sp.]